MYLTFNQVVAGSSPADGDIVIPMKTLVFILGLSSYSLAHGADGVALEIGIYSYKVAPL